MTMTHFWAEVPKILCPPDMCPPGQVFPLDICPPRTIAPWTFVPMDNGHVSPSDMCPPWHLSPSEICPPRIFSNWMNYRWVFYQISVPVYLNFLSSIHIHSYHLNVIHVFYICYQSTIYLFIIWHSSSIYYPKPVIYLAWSCYFETVSLLVHLANCRKQSQSICGHLKNIFRLYHSFLVIYFSPFIYWCLHMLLMPKKLLKCKTTNTNTGGQISEGDKSPGGQKS